MFIFCRLKINHDTHEFILDSGIVANNKYPPKWFRYPEASKQNVVYECGKNIPEP
jgi:hypothetical protein